MDLYAATLTVTQVEAEVQRIATLGPHADEMKHVAEDNLHQTVLEAIAINQLSGVDAQRAALAALKTSDIDFGRWYA